MEEGREEGGGQVAISAKQGKVITTELLDGMTQKAVSASINSHLQSRRGSSRS
jgi:hypothetical protein